MVEYEDRFQEMALGVLHNGRRERSDKGERTLHCIPQREHLSTSPSPNPALFTAPPTRSSPSPIQPMNIDDSPHPIPSSHRPQAIPTGKGSPQSSAMPSTQATRTPTTDAAFTFTAFAPETGTTVAVAIPV